jgi:hypothetical protein
MQHAKWDFCNSIMYLLENLFLMILGLLVFLVLIYRYSGNIVSTAMYTYTYLALMFLSSGRTKEVVFVLCNQHSMKSRDKPM